MMEMVAEMVAAVVVVVPGGGAALPGPGVFGWGWQRGGGSAPRPTLTP